MAPETVAAIPTDVMIDIETMALTPDALVLSIGVVAFTPRSPTLAFSGHELLLVPNFMDQVMRGRRIDPDTQTWWASPQRAAAADHWLAPAKTCSTAETLRALSDFIRTEKPERVWANGAVFDIGILEHLYRSAGFVIPWKYNQVRDSRTIRQELPALPDRNTPVMAEGLAHHPIGDCRVQIADLWIRGF